jgi:DNA-binding NtrC family response regulator
MEAQTAANETQKTADQTVLVVDDEKNIRRTLRMVLEAEGYEVLTTRTAEEGLQKTKEQNIDCLLMDVKLPNMDGVTALERIKSGRAGDASVPVIMISGHASVSDAVQATRLGAFDFFEKPLDRHRVLVSVRNALQRRRIELEIRELRERQQERFEMVGHSPLMEELFGQIEKVAPTRGRVLITGESGTGKELVARAIHQNSQVANGPFVKVNCAAIPPELIESELFGHEKGSFTGATGRKKGLFEAAAGGTIFLDEVGDMSLSAQAKVLRVLQSGELVRVGGQEVIKVEVRVIAATNKDLKEQVAQNNFREDLFFRLNVIPLHTPALRKRPEDIPPLVERFVDEFCTQNGFKRKSMDPAVVKLLQGYDWPGNVRELKNLIERLVILGGSTITKDDLPDYLAGPSTARVDLRRFAEKPLREFREQMERAFILLKLEECGWNISQTAKNLGIERTNLHKKIKSYGLRKETQ